MRSVLVALLLIFLVLLPATNATAALSLTTDHNTYSPSEPVKVTLRGRANATYLMIATSENDGNYSRVTVVTTDEDGYAVTGFYLGFNAPYGRWNIRATNRTLNETAEGEVWVEYDPDLARLYFEEAEARRWATIWLVVQVLVAFGSIPFFMWVGLALKKADALALASKKESLLSSFLHFPARTWARMFAPEPEAANYRQGANPLSVKKQELLGKQLMKMDIEEQYGTLKELEEEIPKLQRELEEVEAEVDWLTELRMSEPGDGEE
jgi:hypothetical protein